MRIPTNTCWVNMYTHVYPTACAADSDVSQRDLRRVLAALSVPIAPLDLRNVFRAIDTDHSGALSFAKVCTCITHASHMHHTCIAHADHSGAFSCAEVCTCITHACARKPCMHAKCPHRACTPPHTRGPHGQLQFTGGSLALSCRAEACTHMQVPCA